MIIGENRVAVIENVKNAANNGEFYTKVELNDPVLTREQSDEIVFGYLKNRKTAAFKFKSFLARHMANAATAALNRETQIVGLQKAKGISGGAIITSNHFSPIENTGIRHIVRKLGKKRINIVSQETNLAFPGIIGFLMNYADIIPMSNNVHYMQRDFAPVIEELINKNEYVLIYPEQEMWFNYRKPRPPKRGAYYYAARMNVPIISCFIEMQEKPEMERKNFHKVRFVVHVLDVLYPDAAKSVKQNSEEMCKKDYELKKAVYERVYGKELSYTFDKTDIAGWTGEDDEQ